MINRTTKTALWIAAILSLLFLVADGVAIYLEARAPIGAAND